MLGISHFTYFSPVVVESLLLALLLVGSFSPVECFHFNYPLFNDSTENDFHLMRSEIAVDAIHVTPDFSGSPITNFSGQALYKRSFKLWSESKGTASFNTTFVLRITPRTDPGGEGLAFILTGRATLPENSEGKWLGIVNASTNGSAENQIVAVEFDTRKSYMEDLSNNHIGVNVNSVYSIKQANLSINLSSGTAITVKVQYDGKILRAFVGTQMKAPAIALPINLSDHLPQKVFVGFSASTGNHTQLNCVRSWEFSGSSVDEDPDLLWVWIMVPVTVLVSGVAFYFSWKWNCGKQEEEEDDPRVEQQIQGSSTAPRKFRLKELKAATENFNSKNELGKGGFGTVYKGFLKNKEVAVKRFSRNSHQSKQDFIAEVTTISNLHHKNLVKLVGWCYEKRELLLIYEFMPNTSLDKLIFCKESDVENRITLNWETRYLIICGVAQALDYLHNGCEKRVLHRDIKASNIMLDSDFNARLGDFGLARIIQLSDQTHHSTKEIAGTPGYMAPESFHTGRAAVETDVYAFGILVLEVVCGRKPGDQSLNNKYNNGIVDWVWEYYRRQRILDVLDLRLNGVFHKEQTEYALMLALSCCHPNPYQRPSMRIALRVLTGEVDPPVIPIEKPPFVWPATPPDSFREDLEYPPTGGLLSPPSELIGR
ncbi:probable L-type lectin-domain containing receptor kinase S.5 [Vitis vinifera]|nr:probable L-type lectin-domain containing receptor kinase S.5 [Vitis vinifera]|eukprot:XP_019071841.1 PREDICTED: probable L-type lectin-domain containing receptor kinase S.5 isoform X1 [Vitis vinifera]